MRGTITRRATAALLAAPWCAQAQAQTAWPTRPVRVIVPWAPGGAVDIIARLMAGHLGEALGQPFPVENRTGGGGIIGFGEAARAASDGSALLVLDNSYAMLPHTTERLPWDVANAFVPIVLIASAPFMLVVNAASRFQDLRQFLAAAREAPEALSFGTGGNGSSPHFVAEAFQQAADVRLLHVPFRGGAEALTAVVAGQVDFSMATIPAARGQLAAGRLRALAIAAAARSPLMPDVPTFAELGLPSVLGGIWAGFAMPSGTPAPIVERVETTTQAALQDPELRRRLTEQGLEPGGLGQQAFGALLRSDTERWGRVAEKAGFARR
ncbi:tripartite tricarboxylate transporter substrate-binding protein [Roseomonas sp. NAR14]|uniref:Tripartite tricarboxylate transporter substrate-binding protein n=1 Tax=Roseomonas acroporae TaxID=2937791 RepID=A0A9X1YBI2_9PROT|nr:tripartite tricarboxylate transporter substrate-binding protein [Roseomonas acroporae]MCK8787389.1 tripartite tricarboxylate transporter substrate-binding protein [Roseomonas acroporae]